MPDYKDWITYVISIIGVLVTALFNFLLWKATKRTADIAKSTLDLNKELAEREEKRQRDFNDMMKSQLARQIWKESEKAYHALADIDETKIYKELKSAPIELSVSDKEIVKYFSKEEVEVINKAWGLYTSYREKYFRLTYGGNEMKILVENAPPVLDAFGYLQNIL